MVYSADSNNNNSTSTPIHQVVSLFTNDHRLDNLTNDVAEINRDIVAIDQQFELQFHVSPIDIEQLSELLKRVKSSRSHVSYVLEMILLEIQSTPYQSFLSRILQETLRIEVEHDLQVLKLYANEILGHLSDVSQFGRYYYSESLAFTKQFLSSQTTDLLNLALQVDTALSEAYRNDPLQGKINATQKQKIESSLRQIVTDARSIRDSLATEYYSEIERIRLEDYELYPLQQSESEALIDSMNYIQSFVKKFEDIVQRINVVG